MTDDDLRPMSPTAVAELAGVSVVTIR